MFSCQVKDVFDQPFKVQCMFLHMYRGVYGETSFAHVHTPPLYMCRKNSYTLFRMTVHSQILNTASTVQIILSKLQTKVSFLFIYFGECCNH